jgi:hypothetical protein
LSNPIKDIDQIEKSPTAPLPQKNAVSPPASEGSKHEERLLDKALEDTFPASDPITEPVKCSEEEEVRLRAEKKVMLHEECLLDEALELTFPASDPIAISDQHKFAKPALLHHGH